MKHDHRREYKSGERIKFLRQGDVLHGKVLGVSEDGRRIHVKFDTWMSTEWLDQHDFNLFPEKEDA